MPSARAKTIALLAGLAAVVVAGAVGLNWREIYYAFRPEARFWGRWEIPRTGKTRSFVLEFDRDGEADILCPQRRPDGSRLLVSLRGFLDAQRPPPTYTVGRREIVFSGLDASGFVVPSTVVAASSNSAMYRFESEDTLVLELAKPILGHEKTLTLRRLPEHGDADD